MFPRTVIPALGFLLLCISASAQNKAEMKMYEKTMANPSVQAFDKYLKKYPDAAHSEEIRLRKDTLLNICTVPAEEITGELKGFFPEGSDFRCVGFRSRGEDRFIGFCVSSENVPAGTVRIISVLQGKSSREQASSFDYPVCEPCLKMAFAESPGEVSLGGVRYLAFAVDVVQDASSSAFCVALFNPLTMDFKQLTFSGRTLPDGRLEGTSDENLQIGTGGEEKAYMLSRMEANPNLVRLAVEDLLTDEAIRWWMDNNRQAAGKSSATLKFGKIPESSSLVRKFNSARDCQKSSGYTAALFDIRDHTVIVAKVVSTGEYVLCWAEPKCVNPDRNRYLNHIYFEKGSSLVLFYYHGKRTYKWRLNLAAKTFTR